MGSKGSADQLEQVCYQPRSAHAVKPAEMFGDTGDVGGQKEDSAAAVPSNPEVPVRRLTVISSF